MFTKDKQIARRYEDAVCRIISKKYPNTHVIDGFCPDGDVYVPEIDMFIEVKYDRLVKSSGNFFIECEFEGEESGIRNSKAEYYVLCDGESGYMIPTEILKGMVRDKRPIRTVIELKSVAGYLLEADKVINSPYTTRYSIAIDNRDKLE